MQVELVLVMESSKSEEVLKFGARNVEILMKSMTYDHTCASEEFVRVMKLQSECEIEKIF